MDREAGAKLPPVPFVGHAMFRSFTRSLCFGLLPVSMVWAQIPDASRFDPLATQADLPALKQAQGLSVRPEGLCGGLAPSRALGVVEVVDLALCNNPQTKETWANTRVQAAQLGVARAAFLPSVDARGTASRIRGDRDTYSQNTAALTLTWLVYDFGARQAAVDNTQSLLAAALATQDAMVQAVFLQAVQATYGAQAARAALVSAQEAERAAAESLAAAESRYQNGTGTPADRLQAKTAYSQAVLARIRAEGDWQNSLGVLANVMGMDAGQPLQLQALPAVVPDAAFTRQIAVLIDEARARRPDLKAAEAQVRAAEAARSAAVAAGMPTVSVSAGPSWQELRQVSSEGGSVGLTLTVPLFSGFSTTYKVQAAEAQLAVRQAQREKLMRQVALDVWKAYQSLQTAGQAVASSADLVASAEQSAKVALGRYKAGVGNVLDVLNAQSALASARLQRIQAGLDWWIYRATLAQAIGGLDYSALPGEQEGMGKR